MPEVLAPKAIPERFHVWNARHYSPFGRSLPTRLERILGKRDIALRLKGPFAWQVNNTSRRFEYPWAYEQVTRFAPHKGTVMDVGGSLSGLQFVLAHEGFSVVNVDPGLAATGLGWRVDSRFHARLARALRAPVTLSSTTIGAADIAPGSIDIVLSVSTIEHFSPADILEFASTLPKLLKPGGHVVLTVDLFLNTSPFTRAERNEYGANVDVCKLLELAGLELLVGRPAELNGFPDFDPDRIQSDLDRYLIGSYPTLTQCIVARRKPGFDGAP